MMGLQHMACWCSDTNEKAIIKMNRMVRNLGNISPSPSELSKRGCYCNRWHFYNSVKRNNCPTMVSRECEMAACQCCNIITFKDGHLKAQLHELIKQCKPQYWLRVTEKATCKNGLMSLGSHHTIASSIQQKQYRNNIWNESGKGALCTKLQHTQTDSVINCMNHCGGWEESCFTYIKYVK
jgi:hypothetical protein